jgi:hypothetical protein
MIGLQPLGAITKDFDRNYLQPKTNKIFPTE